MKRKMLFLLSLVSLMSLPSYAQTLQNDLEAMVASERAFSKLCGEKGFKESFLTYIADDGILFRPTPVNGKQMLAANPNPPITLVWWPSHAEIAQSGEMGWTTGPWERQVKGKPEVAHGHFLTVWKKQADGNWRWMVDTGIEHAKPTAPEGSPGPASGQKSRAKVDAAAETQALLTVDRELGQATAKGTSAAYLTRIADDTRLMRAGAFPHVGKEAVRAALEKAPAAMTSAPEGGGVSAAGDLGYTYGTAEWTGAKVGYLRIWKKHEGAWKLRVDWVDNPPPPPPTKS